MRPHHALLPAAAARLRVALLLLLPLLLPGRWLLPSPARAEEAGPRPSVAVFPFRVHSAKPLAHLGQSLPELLRSRLAASGRVDAPSTPAITGATPGVATAEPTDASLRQLAHDVGTDWAVSGSLTELAGRFSLDVRLVPADPRAAPHGLSLTAQNEDELLDRVNELSERILETVSKAGRALVMEVRLEGGEGLVGPEVRQQIRTRAGQPYDAAIARSDLSLLRGLPGVASASLETQPREGGVSVVFRLVGAERIFGVRAPTATGERVAEVRVEGNHRIEADAIRARISTKAGDPYRPAQIAADVRQVFGLGFFRDVRVVSDEGIDGRIITFQVQENPVVRQVAITGNDSIDSEKIRNALTLTTGSTLDYPLLYENTARIEALYRAEGFYLAKVQHKIEPLSEDAVAVDFEVEEGKKLRLKEIRFEGNKALSSSELLTGLKTKRWRVWSIATHYLDNSGTYSEPVFLQDLRTVEQKYTNKGYLQVEVGDPRVEPAEDGLVVVVDIKEGDQFSVGTIDVTGDQTVDVDKLRERLKLKQGEIFNRSFLTQDVDTLTHYFTDRGFYFANVNPRTAIEADAKKVDVSFDVQRGPLYFIRDIEVMGNTTTVDPVVRREVQLVEGQLYSARAIQISKARLQGLGFFEEVNFEPKPTDRAGQLDLDVKVVEKPTGSLSFGAGFSSVDKFILTASLAQTNLFGRGYGAQISADIGGIASNFYLSFTDPYVFGSTWSFSSTLFRTDILYLDFQEKSTGVDLSLAHALNEDNTARGFLGYSYALRGLTESTNVNAAALIFREILAGQQSTSMFGLTYRTDQIDDRIAPKKGYQLAGSLDYAGLGGFSQFVRGEARGNWYIPAPDWGPLAGSTFLLGGRTGYTLPLNSIGDWSFNLPKDPLAGVPTTYNDVAQLDMIDTNLTLPLTERYFLGGLGPFQLRGYQYRSVGPRRPVLRRNNIVGSGPFFLPVGRTLVETDVTDPITGQVLSRTLTGVCQDTSKINQGNGNGKCNSLSDTKISDFADLKETDVIGGNKYLSLTTEYRFPISESLGLIGIVFLDAGNAFAENENMLNVKNWRYGTGFGALWFSPFGPLQAFYGIPLNPLSVEDRQVFEFSVGGANF